MRWNTGYANGKIGDKRALLRHACCMKPIAKWSWVAATAVVAILIVAAPYLGKQFKLASQHATILKLPVLDVFPVAKDDGTAKLLVIITNRSDEKIVPIEFSVLAPKGGSTPPSQETAHATIAPGTVGVLFADYVMPEQTETLATMMARIKYLGAVERTETLLVTRALN
jgi:hypothetical protein